MLRQCFSPQRITVEILRSAYITHFYSDPRKTLKDTDELDRLMRHSSKIAEREYHKIDVSSTIHPDPLVVTSNMMASTTEVPPPIVVEMEYFDLKKWRKNIVKSIRTWRVGVGSASRQQGKGVDSVAFSTRRPGLEGR